MFTNVTFHCPREFVPVSDEDGILSVRGAEWFVALLGQIPEIEVKSELCQEDWGVVVFAKCGRSRFWIGLSAFPEGDANWIAHVHHGPGTLMQRFLPSGKQALRNLASALHLVLKKNRSISAIRWFTEAEMRSGKNRRGSNDPNRA